MFGFHQLVFDGWNLISCFSHVFAFSGGFVVLHCGHVLSTARQSDIGSERAWDFPACTLNFSYILSLIAGSAQ